MYPAARIVAGPLMTMSAYDGFGIDGADSGEVAGYESDLSVVDKDCFRVVLLPGSP